MNIVVNGKNTDTTDGLTVSRLLIEENVKMPEMVSVELNGRILVSLLHGRWKAVN